MKLNLRNNLVAISLLFSLFCSGQESKTNWDFPIRPGTNEWENLASYEDKLNAYNIPSEIIQQISTSALTDACLSYPEWRLVFTRNSFTQGLHHVFSVFNGFEHLIKREGVLNELYNRYDSMSPAEVNLEWSLEEQGLYGFSITYIELMLSHPLILERSSVEAEQLLLQQAIKKYNEKRSLPQLYSIYGLSPTALICARILIKNDFIKGLDSNRMASFNNTGLSPDPKFLDQIILEAEKFLSL